MTDNERLARAIGFQPDEYEGRIEGWVAGGHYFDEAPNWPNDPAACATHLLPWLATKLPYLEVGCHSEDSWFARDHTDEGLGGDMETLDGTTFAEAVTNLSLAVLDAQEEST